MFPKFARGLAAAAAAASLLFASAAVGQAQRWNVVTPGLGPAAGLPYTRFAAADPSGNLYVAARRWNGGSGSCFVTLKYAGGSGDVAWRREVCTAEPDSGATSVAVDAAGDVFVTGKVAVCCATNSNSARADFRTIKYRGSDGTLLWERSWNPGNPSLNVAYNVTLDPNGNPYVVGTSYSGVRFQLKIIKYNAANGDVIWETLHDGEGDYSIVGAGVEPNGDLLVGTNVDGSIGIRPEIFDFSGAGGFNIWRYRSSVDERLTAFTVDRFGAAIAALYAGNATTLNRDIRIRKHGTMGSTLWQRDYGSAGEDTPWGVAADAAGNIVVAAGLGGIYDLLRYTRDGQLLFESTYSTQGRPAQANAVAFDAEGNIVSAGLETTPEGEFMRVAKQDSSLGEVRWQSRIGGGGSTREAGIAIVPAGQTVYAISLETVTAPVDPALRIVNFSNAPSGTNVNVHGLWWNEAQSGWGINLVQQGEKLFATWYLYDTDGQGMWLVMSDGVPSGTNSWSGQVHRSTGPAFYNFNSSSAPQVAYALVGTGTLTFIDGNHGTMTTTINGVARSNNITRFQFGAMPACALGGSAPSTPNYTDIWWRPSEPGWGVSLAHQGDTLFALWYTYSADARGMWLVGSKLDRVADRLYSGPLYRTTGTPFASSTWQLPQYQPAGSVTLNFTDADNAVMDYTVGGITQSKPITRYVFATPVSVCR